jgi:hypothetical protein
MVLVTLQHIRVSTDIFGIHHTTFYGFMKCLNKTKLTGNPLTVNHDILLTELQFYGIMGPAHKLITSYIKDIKE